MNKSSIVSVFMNYVWWVISPISRFRDFHLKSESDIMKTWMIFVISPGVKNDNTKYATKNHEILTGKGPKITSLKFSCPRLEIFCVSALYLSYLRVFAWRESQNNAICSKRRHENTKLQKLATIIIYIFTIKNVSYKEAFNNERF